MFYFSYLYFYYQTVIKFIIFMPYSGYHKFSINNCWCTSFLYNNLQKQQTIQFSLKSQQKPSQDTDQKPSYI